MKKILTLYIACFCMVCSVNAQQITVSPEVAAKGAVLMDMDTGRVLWGKNENEPMTMASTTKIMTAIIALEKGNMDDVVTTSQRAASAAKVKMNLQAGETHRLEDLLYAMMLKSYNDAAVAVAEHIGGSVEDFCDMMTKKAKEIGAKDTVFASPNGLDSNLDFEKHHSTAYDMALITRYALNNEDFVKIINTMEITIPIKGGTDKSYTIVNADRFLSLYDGAFGVKTGFTNKAGQCFVGAAKREDTKLISVVLASGWGTAGKEQKWKDTKKIMDYGFDNFEYATIVKEGTKVKESIGVKGSKTKEISVKFGGGITMLLNKNGTDKVQTELYMPSELNAPIKKGQEIGNANIVIDDTFAVSIPLVAEYEVEGYNLKKTMEQLKNKWCGFTLNEVKNPFS